MPNLAAAISKYQGVEPVPLDVRTITCQLTHAQLIELILCSTLHVLTDLEEKGLVHRFAVSVKINNSRAIHPRNIFTDGTKVRISDAAVEAIASYLWEISQRNIGNLDNFFMLNLTENVSALFIFQHLI